MSWEISGNLLILSGRCSIREVENLRQGLLASNQVLELQGEAVESIDTPYLQLVWVAQKSGRVGRVKLSDPALRRAKLLGLDFSSGKWDEHA